MPPKMQHLYIDIESSMVPDNIILSYFFQLNQNYEFLDLEIFWGPKEYWLLFKRKYYIILMLNNMWALVTEWTHGGGMALQIPIWGALAAPCNTLSWKLLIVCTSDWWSQLDPKSVLLYYLNYKTIKQKNMFKWSPL